MTVDKPYYIVFAGVNGAGKSTLFHSGLWQCEDMPAKMERINPDEILQELKGNPDLETDQVKAGRIALQRIKNCFSKRKSFNQETTLSGQGAIKRIKIAHDLGYRVYLYYVGVESVDIALARIAHRVELGGHNIDTASVQKRFDSSLDNLFRVIPYCEHVAVLDNTIELARVATWTNGMISWWGNPKTYAPWLISKINQGASD